MIDPTVVGQLDKINDSAEQNLVKLKEVKEYMMKYWMGRPKDFVDMQRKIINDMPEAITPPDVVVLFDNLRYTFDMLESIPKLLQNCT